MLLIGVHTVVDKVILLIGQVHEKVSKNQNLGTVLVVPTNSYAVMQTVTHLHINGSRDYVARQTMGNH